MTLTKISRTGAAALLALALTSGCSAIAAGAAPQPDPTPFPANQAELNEIADAAALLGRQRFPEAFAGVAIDTASDTVIIWRKPSPSFDEALMQQPGSAKVVLKTAEHSSAQLEAVHERLRNDQPLWAGRGITLHDIGARTDGACVEVGTEDPERADRELRAHYDGLPLCFVSSRGWTAY